MEAPKRKVTAKLSSHNINGHTGSIPSISPQPQIVVRAKISSTARSRTNSTTSALGNANVGTSSPNINGVLRPQAHTMARRSPSPAKMVRSPSPSKLQAPPKHTTARTLSTKLSALKPHVDHTRHGSASALCLPPIETSGSSTSAPTTPLTRTSTKSYSNGDASPPSGAVSSGSASLRIKSKISGLVKSTPSLATVISPPSPSSSSQVPIPLPSATRLPRARATTLASRRASVSFSVSQPSTSQPVSFPNAHRESPQLVPLPTSPPASTLSFSSRSSTSASASASASASSAQSYSTSTGITHPISFTNHARSDSQPSFLIDDSLRGGPSSRDGRSLTPPRLSPPLKRTLVARVRPGTNISGGRGQGWTSGSSVAGDRGLNIDSQALSDLRPRRVGTDDESTEESDRSADETRVQGPDPGLEDNPEDDVRAEAKSNRKIADLEITTRSLLTINAALEASKLRQAREIRELRRKLRETRLAMPPGRFRLLVEGERDAEAVADVEGEETDEEEEDGVVGDEEDERFKRVKTLIEDLLAAGRTALAVPAPSSLLGAQTPLGAPSTSYASGSKTGLGITIGAATGTRMDQGEVLGWDMGSGLGTNSGSAEVNSRRWKHGVAIGSRVLSPEEAKMWVEGEKEGGDECQGEEEDVDEAGHGADREGGIDAADEDTSDLLDDAKVDVDVDGAAT